ncbi:MAG: PAS domain S-box protein [Janthinobacterium lividum]
MHTDKFLQGGGKMGELIRAKDWLQTELGEPGSWPESLKSALSICLNSGFPIAIYWGADFTLFYNDAWSTIPGDKHPWALGKSGATVWPEIWDGLEAEFVRVLTNAESVRSDNALLPMFRFGYLEECYFDYTLSPVIAADGSVGGVFNAVIETSYRTITERRNLVLHNLLKVQNESVIAQGIIQEIKVLDEAKLDLPFSLLYKAHPENLNKPMLVAASGIIASAFAGIDLLLAEVVEKGIPFHIENLAAYTKDTIASAWPEVCNEALIVPVNLAGTAIKICLVAGISPRKKLDADYARFIESVARSMSIAIVRDYNFAQEQKNKLRLEESENRFRSMIDKAPVAIAVFRGENLLISKANNFLLQLIGRQKDIIGQNLLEAIPELAGQPMFKILKEVFETGKAYFDYNMPVNLQRNGKAKQAYFDFSFSPLVEEGQVTGVLEVVTEVTERFKAQEKLQESEALFRGITAASPTALWITDENGNITYVNETWLRWTGKPLESQLGKGWLKAVVPEDFAQTHASFTDDFLVQRYHEQEFKISDAKGQERSLICTGNPQFDDQQKFKGYIGACVDITEQKQLQRQKDDFLGIASHELKTPVTSIKAYAQVLEMMFRRDGDTQKAEMLAKLNKQVNRLNSLIGDLLDVTKLHTGRMQFNETDFNFNQLVEEVIEDVQHTSPKHRIKKQLNFDEVIRGDKERISQVITNLLTNAIKYSPDANEIIIYTEQKNGRVQLSVQDFGIGISLNKKDKVFEQFYRVSGSKEHTFPGLGLGLYISSEIVKRLNGRIWVNSIEGKGSTFYFDLSIKN